MSEVRPEKTPEFTVLIEFASKSLMNKEQKLKKENLFISVPKQPVEGGQSCEDTWHKSGNLVPAKHTDMYEVSKQKK